jgi:UDP-N-acetylglucosamine 4,6-dehydratase
MYKDKIICVDGGTGSWGRELVTQLLPYEPKEIRIFSRGEFAQFTMKNEYHNNPKLKFIIGDIRDYYALKHATKNVDILFHCAALKHVPVCEEQPDEAIKTNINGTQNIIDVAIENNIKKVIDVSTDKAANPLSFYGLTKAVGERLMLQARAQASDTQFLVIRGGNALGSQGSVVPYFISQIQKENRITITDERMTRFFLHLSEAIKLLFLSVSSELSGGLFVMKMPTCKIIDLAKVLIGYYGNSTTKIEKIPIRPGEKLYETLVSQYEAPDCYEYNNKYYLVYPYAKLEYPKVQFEEYNSNYLLMNEREIEVMLKKGGFLK